MQFKTKHLFGWHISFLEAHMTEQLKKQVKERIECNEYIQQSIHIHIWQ